MRGAWCRSGVPLVIFGAVAYVLSSGAAAEEKGNLIKLLTGEPLCKVKAMPAS